MKSMSLLNLLCNASQGNKTINRDACYGCFFRASSQAYKSPLLLEMANCATSYLKNTQYGHCAEYLKNATMLLTSSRNSSLVYCTFLECIRQVNKDNLILQCLMEAKRLTSFYNGTNIELAQVYVSTSACILAKTRCSEPNPITGENRKDKWKRNLSVNALVVNTDNKINIISLPFSTFTLDECYEFRNIQLASWPNVDC